MAMAAATALDSTDYNMGEEEDEVLHELDVYISRSLGKLLLAQYPLRPTYKPYQNAARESVRMRPVQCELEVDMKIQSNPNKPSQIQKLTVSQRPMLKPHSAIGLVRGNELHLTPLDSVLQLTPCFEHIDKRVAEEAKLNETEAPESTATQSVTRKFTKVETDRDKAIRLSSYQNIQQQRQSESWVPCDYKPPEHPYSAGQKRAMINKKDKGVTGAEVSRSQYLDMFLPGTTATTETISNDRVLGLRDLPSLPNTKQKVETLMRNAKVLSFSEICEILSGIPKMELLEELQKCANLVQGHWVISSKLLYPKGSRSGQTGVPAELMVRHRDFILCCFVQSPIVKRKHLQSISRIHPTEIEEILKQVSRLTPREGWVFCKTPSAEFALQYPDVDQNQKSAWNEIYDDIYSTLHLKLHRNNPLVERRMDKPPINKELTCLNVEKATQIISNLQLEEIVDPFHLVELSNEFRDLIGPSCALVEVVENSMCRYIPPEYCKQVLNEMCAPLRLYYVSVLIPNGEREQAIGYEKIGNISDKYRQIIFSLYESRYQISKSELREAIHKQMQTHLTSKEYHELTSLLCDSPTAYRSGHWILRVKRKP